MKNSPTKNFKKKTNKLYSYNGLSLVNQSDPTGGDPTNTTITILTTVSRPAYLLTAGDVV
jgi:hypothetical protein